MVYRHIGAEYAKVREWGETVRGNFPGDELLSA